MDELWERIFVALEFAVLGPIIEICYTGVAAWWNDGDERLRGHVSVAMIPAYAFVGLLFPFFYGFLDDNAWYVRGVAYTCIGLVLEFLYGALLLRITGSYFWRHEGPIHLRHHTDPRFFLVFFFGSLLLEMVFRYLHLTWRQG